jgi:hypothetical protein
MQVVRYLGFEPFFELIQEIWHGDGDGVGAENEPVESGIVEQVRGRAHAIRPAMGMPGRSLGGVCD